MIKKIIFCLVLLIFISFQLFSQTAFDSSLTLLGRNVSKSLFSRAEGDFRMSAIRSGFHEIGFVPDYVWQDISKQISKFYGNNPPIVGDLFQYFGYFFADEAEEYLVAFRISNVNGMSIAKWDVVVFKQKLF
jgi:hypothetical protein